MLRQSSATTTSPKPQPLSLSDLLADVSQGRIKIPKFQRDFIWTKEKAAKLLDSILKGYPVGTFILWRTHERLREVREIGNMALPETPDGDYVNYVLDGQQRMTSLVASIKGVEVVRDGGRTNFQNLWVDLAATEGDIVLTEQDARRPEDFIRVCDLFERDFTLLNRYPAHHHQTLNQLMKRLSEYQFATINVHDVPIEVATEIFTRINVTGQRLTLFEIMVAKTYSVQRNFDLADRTDALMDELLQVDYGTIAPSTILQVVSGILTRDCTAKTILNLERERFIDVWDEAAEAIKSTVDFFRNQYRIPVSNLLPYNALVVSFAYFFHKHPDRPSGRTAELLQDFFWRASLAARYSATVEQKLAQDIRRIETILEGEQPEYDWGIDLTAEFILQNGYFQTSRSYVKAILCLLVYFQPKSFDDNSIVRVSNDWLKKANSKNYHHFFPRAYLRRQGVEDGLANHVANITFVDDYLNKRVIRDRAPSDYIGDFAQRNPSIAETLQTTHLIALDDAVWQNDYEAFLHNRIEHIRGLLAERVVPTRMDNLGQVVNIEDFDPFEMDTSDAT